MNYDTAAAFRSALEARLNRQSRERGLSLTRLRKLVVFDRLLARLAMQAPDRWVMKGGVALEYRLAGDARTTMDLDVAWQGGRDDVARHLASLPGLSLDDFFVFSVEKVGDADGGHRVMRYRISAELDGRRFDSVVLDVGLDYLRDGETEFLSGPDLLGFADIPSTPVPVVSLERQLAEKLHAYTRSYESGRASTRVKDFVDILLIGSSFTVQAGRLHEALHTVFGERGKQGASRVGSTTC